uniref:NADH-ubiquinone oxidoreductase chain 4 n=1 Tax=Lanthanaphalara mira TaxID=2218050 RepID=A0A344A2G5_9HEMI|nr:NADH dehydrogenase subunit 4 [Lanthanaphalara mira]AWU48956.1 NADH dehydrogenase subunit 4 [Lanthanaphalara mira]
MLELIFVSFFFVVIFKVTLILNFMVLFFLYLIFMMFDDGIYLIKLALVALSFWLIIMMFMSINFYDYKSLLSSMFIMVLILLEICFYSDSLLFFYLGFEMSVIPVFLIIFGWGYHSNRLEASIYMLSYTVLFSLPLLVMIMMLNKNMLLTNMIVMYMFFCAFLVKVPMFGVHLWLPRAHVEAPVFGSMILAGVMLKLGGYGIIKLSLILGDVLLKFSSYIIIYSMMGSFYLSLICFLQSDVKMLIAYSSIVHMGVVLSGLLTMREICLNSSMFLMVGHGLCSSGLFYSMGLGYNRLHSRSLLVSKGLLNLIPLFSLYWFMFCSSNLSFPPCLSFAGELGLFIGVASWNYNMFMLIIVVNLFSSMYSIFLYSFVQHGESIQSYSFKMLNIKELMTMSLHWIPLNILILTLKIMCWY